MKKLDPKSPEFRELVDKTINLKLNLPLLKIPVEKTEGVINLKHLPMLKEPSKISLKNLPKYEIAKGLENLTGNKDTDFLIMNMLNDQDLSSLCQTNKYLAQRCTDDEFWKRRFMLRFSVLKKPEGKSWKNHYMQIATDLAIFKGREIEFFDRIFWYKNIQNSLYVDEKRKKLIPLLEAPQEIFANLYFLNIENIKIKNGTVSFDSITPFQLLNEFTTENNKYITGFFYGNTKDNVFRAIKNRWIPIKVNKKDIESSSFSKILRYNGVRIRISQKF